MSVFLNGFAHRLGLRRQLNDRLMHIGLGSPFAIHGGGIGVLTVAYRLGGLEFQRRVIGKDKADRARIKRVSSSAAMVSRSAGSLRRKRPYCLINFLVSLNHQNIIGL
jgi:hypothetical protein